MPDNYKKSANIRSNRVPVEDKRKNITKKLRKDGNRKNINVQNVGKLIKIVTGLFTTKYVNR